MAAGYLELFVEQGESFSATIGLTSMNDASVNLYSCSVKSEIRKSYWSANTTAKFDTTVYPATGEVAISLDANTTQNIISGRYVYDLFITDEISSTRSKILEGILFVEPSSTKI